jgi:hypothetical protein
MGLAHADHGTVQLEREKMDTDALIIGLGEVGQALRQVLKEVYTVQVIDPAQGLPDRDVGTVRFMHVCIPYSPDFEGIVRDYQTRYRPAYTVIHSSVPVGTSRRCDAYHSPVMGKHPDLTESLTTFTKFVGGTNPEPVLEHLRRAGITCYPFDNQETAELCKLMSTTFYAWLIEYTKEVHDQCWGHSVPFMAWTLWTQAYNAGYSKLGHPEYTRPLLFPMAGPIGGHCILPNAEHLGGDLAQFILDRNRDQGEE